MDGRSFYIIKLIAEGGYSFVYLVREGRSTSAHGNGGEYALKKVSQLAKGAVHRQQRIVFS